MSVHIVNRPKWRKHFRVRACIDYLDVTLHTARPSQFRHVQAALERITGVKLYTHPRDKKTDGGQNATVFTVRFRDALANDLLALTDAINEFRKEYSFQSEPTISGIEAACDFRFKGPAKYRERITLAIAHRLQLFLHTPHATRPRQFDPTSGPTGANLYLADGIPRNPRLNYRIGNEWDDVSWQAYFKTTDAMKPIDPTQHRARVEVTLTGDILHGLGLINLSDLDEYDFRKLCRFFKFRSADGDIHDDIQDAIKGALKRLSV